VLISSTADNCRSRKWSPRSRCGVIKIKRNPTAAISRVWPACGQIAFAKCPTTVVEEKRSFRDT
jgi:hypothetical protein